MMFKYIKELNEKCINLHSSNKLNSKDRDFIVNNLVYVRNEEELNKVCVASLNFFKWIESNHLIVEFSVSIDKIGLCQMYSNYKEFMQMSDNNSLFAYLSGLLEKNDVIFISYYKNDIEKKLLENVITEKDKKKELLENIISKKEVNHMSDSFVNISKELSELQSNFVKNKNNIEFSYNELNEKIYKIETRIDVLMRSIETILETQQTLLSLAERILKNG